VPELLRGYVERLQLVGERRGVGDVREQVGDRDQLAVVEPRGDEAGVAVPPLLAIGHHAYTRSLLGRDRQPHRVVGVPLELVLGQPARQPLVQRPEEPRGPRPTADAHHRQRWDCRSTDWRVYRLRGFCDGDRRER
jgi:hypothetical protein